MKPIAQEMLVLELLEGTHCLPFKERNTPNSPQRPRQFDRYEDWGDRKTQCRVGRHRQKQNNCTTVPNISTRTSPWRMSFAHLLTTQCTVINLNLL